MLVLPVVSRKRRFRENLEAPIGNQRKLYAVLVSGF